MTRILRTSSPLKFTFQLTAAVQYESLSDHFVTPHLEKIVKNIAFFIIKGWPYLFGLSLSNQDCWQPLIPVLLDNANKKILFPFYPIIQPIRGKTT